MGTPSLEQTLRRRLFFILGPVCLGVGVASVAIAARALDTVDDDTATKRAASALRMLKDELAEGDDVATATHEVLLAAESDGVRLLLRGRALGPPRTSTEPLPSDLTPLAPGHCATAKDENGDAWRACAAKDGESEAVAAVSVEAHRVALRTLALSMLGVVAAFFVGAILAARAAVRRVLSSLKELVAWSERVAASDEAPAAPTASTKELERLTGAFESLVRRLFEALARERANSAHIAHELRTPLTALSAELEALPGGDAAATRMREDVDKLTRVIDAVLVLSAPPTRRPGETVNVADLARGLAPTGTAVDAPDEALVLADARLVELALRNLLENAEKYSGHAALALRVTRDEGAVRVAVVDDGPGLDEDARAKMFDRHWRAATDGPGSGLGLALVRAVAERYGGRADARPNPGGRGLEVGMTFSPVVGWHQG